MSFFGKKALPTISPLAGMIGGEQGFNPLLMMSPFAHLIGNDPKKALPFLSPGLMGLFK
jgi:hypothetical protein